MTKAYSYRRFSSAKQEQGDSLRRQTALAEKYANDHGLELDTTLNMEDLGVSAFKGANVEKGALGSFVKAIDDGLIKPGSFLLVENLDRLSRREVDVALEFFLNITRQGITIVTLDDGVVYSKESIRENWTKLIVALAIMAGAHEQSLNKSRRIGTAWENKRANLATKRLTKMCPAWLRIVDDEWEVIEEKAAGVRRIYELYAEGYGKTSISKILNKEEVPALSEKGWHPNTVQKLLLTRTVIGEFQAFTGRHPNRVPAGDPVADYYPRIIDEDLWNRAQRPKKQSGGAYSKEMVNVFRGLLKCGYCNGAMTLYGNTVKGEYTRHIGCYNYHRGLCKSKRMWNYFEFRDQFLAFVSEIDIATLLEKPDTTKEIRFRINQLHADIAKSDQRISNVTMSLLDDPSPTLNKALRELESQRTSDTKELKALDAKLHESITDVSAIKHDLSEAIAKLNDEHFRLKLNVLLRQLITKIVVNTTGTGLQLEGMSAPDTTRSFTVFFRNGMVRVVKSDFTLKYNTNREINHDH